VSIVHAVGRLDAITAPVLTDSLSKLVTADTPRIVLDLTSVPFVSSAGLRVVLQAAKQVMGRGKFAVCGLVPAVRQVFDMAGFNRILTICESPDSAVTAAAS
jgi:anti-anti-sigma factor